MSRKFREWSPNQAWLFPPSPQDWLPKSHLVYFLLDVSQQIDISPIVNDYHGEKGGQPPFHPRMMLILLLYSYCVGVFSSRKMMARCETDAAFRVIVGEDVPDELSRRETRLEKIREAKAALEGQARQKALAHAAKLKSAGRQPRKDPDAAVPKPKDQRNFTDPESKIMKMSNKGFDQCGNAQTVTNEDQIIVSADVTDQANDVRQVEPMVKKTLENLDAIGVTDNVKAFTADTGYFSEDNVALLEQNDRIEEAYLATGRLKHHEKVPDAPTGRPAKNLTTKEKMARKLRTKKGRAEYARRKAIVEPPFGQIKHCRGFRQFLLRGLGQMQGEWKLVCLTHNLLKLFRSGALAAS